MRRRRDRAAGAGPVSGAGRPVAVPAPVKTMPVSGASGIAPAPLAGRKRVSFAAAIIGITLPVVLMLVNAITELLVTDRRPGCAGDGLRRHSDRRPAPRRAPATSPWGSGRRYEQERGQRLGRVLRCRRSRASSSSSPPAEVSSSSSSTPAWATSSGTGLRASASRCCCSAGWSPSDSARYRVGDGGHDHGGRHRRAAGADPVGQPPGSARAGDRLRLAVLLHVNDAGFWLVKEYFGLTVGETIKSWSVMETVISVFGFAFVILLSLVF